MKKAKILIVEDEAIIAIEIESLLQNLGYQVTSKVDTGDLAIQKAEEDKPDIIMMDIRIKGEMDGIDTAEIIRNRYGIPVIFSTAYLDEERIERAKITKPFGYVLKPIREKDLKVTIEMALYLAKVDLEQKKVELDLRASEKQMSLIYDNTSNYMALFKVETGQNTRLVSINKAYSQALRMLNPDLTRYDVVGLLLEDLCKKLNLPQEIMDIAKGYHVKVLEFLQEVRVLEILPSIDGELYLQDIYSPVFDGCGNCTHILLVVTDITELKKKELELEKLLKVLQKAHSDLENKVKKRTYELERAKKEAEKANRLKSEFLANMSHDLRTPLNAVLGFSDILFQQEREPRKKNYLKSIQTSGKSLLSLINDVLDLSRIEAGKLELQYTAVSIPNLFDEMNAIFHHKVINKGVAFEVRLDSNIPESLLLDETRLRRVLINLLGNAIKFTEEGFIRLSGRVKEAEHEIKSCVDLVIDVEDSGRGIPEKDQQKIFSPFEQVTGQKSTQFGGTGLGLAITKSMVHLMDGSISVESRPGQGSVFSVELREVEITVKKPGETESLEFDPSEIQFAPAKVLIAEDIEYNREVLFAYLDPFDLELFFAENGQEALEQAQKQRPHLILLDMKMPVMDGYEASKLLKNGESTKNIPIVAITASALAHNEETIWQNCDGYLIKPVSQFVLLKELKKFLKHTVVEKTVLQADAGTDMVVPTESQLKKLYDVALDGNMDGITTYLDKLEQEDGKLKEFCKQLGMLALSYNDIEVVSFLKKYLSK